MNILIILISSWVIAMAIITAGLIKSKDPVELKGIEGAFYTSEFINKDGDILMNIYKNTTPKELVFTQVVGK